MKGKKIVIEVPMVDDERRKICTFLGLLVNKIMNRERCSKSRAMRIASTTKGVNSVEIESQKNKLVVKGYEIDPVRLTMSLRKKFPYANLLAVEEEKPPEKEAKPEKPAVADPVITWHPRHYSVCPADYDSTPPYCTIL